MQRTGIYSGTFDPIHDGHVAFAEKVRADLSLSEVVFFPEQNPRGKASVSPMDYRIAAIAARLKGIPGYSTRQLPDKQFSVTNTLPKLQHLYPNSRLVLLVGSDVAARLADWSNIDQLLQYCDIAIGVRMGDDVIMLQKYIHDLFTRYDLTDRSTFHYTEKSHLRSSAIRNGHK